MGGKLTKEEQVTKDENEMSYYFTVVFTAIGTAVVYFILYSIIDKVNLFLIILSMSAGGIPIGFIGAFIDYKVSEYKFEKKSIEQ